MPPSVPRGPSVDETLLDALVQVSFSVTSILTRVAAAHELSLTQLRVLAILRDHTLTMSELADHLGIDRSSVSGLIDRASKRGLVRRVASDVDGRSSRVTLTRAGRSLAATGAREVAAEVETLAGGFTRRDQHALTQLLQRLLEEPRDRV